MVLYMLSQVFMLWLCAAIRQAVAYFESARPISANAGYCHPDFQEEA
jgi:hypothetical protein